MSKEGLSRGDPCIKGEETLPNGNSLWVFLQLRWSTIQ